MIIDTIRWSTLDHEITTNARLEADTTTRQHLLFNPFVLWIARLSTTSVFCFYAAIRRLKVGGRENVDETSQ